MADSTHMHIVGSLSFNAYNHPYLSSTQLREIRELRELVDKCSGYRFYIGGVPCRGCADCLPLVRPDVITTTGTLPPKADESTLRIPDVTEFSRTHEKPISYRHFSVIENDHALPYIVTWMSGKVQPMQKLYNNYQEALKHKTTLVDNGYQATILINAAYIVEGSDD